MSERSPQEINQNYVNKLGQDFGDFFFHLDQSVVGLVSIWDVYRALFGTNKERVDLLNSASGYVTRTFQDSLHERVILGICQVSDPAGAGSRKNVTVRGLPQYMVDAGHRAEIERMLVDVKIATCFARELRNKLIAHSDLSAVRGSHVVDSSSRMKIVYAIKSIIGPLRYVHSQLFDTHKLYHPITEGTYGFLKCVFLGVAKRNEELQLLKTGRGQELSLQELARMDGLRQAERIRLAPYGVIQRRRTPECPLVLERTPIRMYIPAWTSTGTTATASRRRSTD